MGMWLWMTPQHCGMDYFNRHTRLSPDSHHYAQTKDPNLFAYSTTREIFLTRYFHCLSIFCTARQRNIMALMKIWYCSQIIHETSDRWSTIHSLSKYTVYSKVNMKHSLLLGRLMASLTISATRGSIDCGWQNPSNSLCVPDNYCCNLVGQCGSGDSCENHPYIRLISFDDFKFISQNFLFHYSLWI